MGAWPKVDLPTVFALAVGLSMDATAVAAARGIATPQLRPRHALIVATAFGGFQAGMPVLGWLIGSTFGGVVSAFGPWIAFALLAALGLKMIWESRAPPEAVEEREDLYGLRPMLFLSVATSIDAFAVGVTLPLLDAPFAFSIAAIGVTTAVLSASGLYLGRRLGAGLGRGLDAVGGGVLLILGAKILLEHLLG